MVKKQQEHIVSLLKQYEFKVTDQRMRVLGVLMQVRKPLTIDTLQRALPMINTVTLYRMLRQFVACGMVYQTDFRSGKAYFELQATHHHHVVCVGCGVQDAVHACLPKDFLQKVAREAASFTQVVDHTLEFFGRCKKCSK